MAGTNGVGITLRLPPLFLSQAVRTLRWGPVQARHRLYLFRLSPASERKLRSPGQRADRVFGFFALFLVSGVRAGASLAGKDSSEASSTRSTAGSSGLFLRSCSPAFDLRLGFIMALNPFGSMQPARNGTVAILHGLQVEPAPAEISGCFRRQVRGTQDLQSSMGRVCGELFTHQGCDASA